MKLFTFVFYILKRIYFSRKHSLGEFSLYYYISSKVLVNITGYLKQSNETPTSIGLVDVVLSAKMFGNRLSILTTVLIVIDYFFRCQKSTFNLENNK